ncbi:MAG: ATP-binding protein [Solirubrobacteraceae bacterium]
MPLLQFVFVAEPLAAVHARHAASDFARKHGAADQTVGDIALAVSEAVTNAVVHGYRDRPAPGDITMSIRRDGHHLVVMVCDDGVGVSPRRDSPGLGLGLALIGQLSDSLQIRDRREGGAELSMRFRLRPDD